MPRVVRRCDGSAKGVRPDAKQEEPNDAARQTRKTPDVRRQADDYPEHLGRVVRTIVSDGIAAGAAALAPIAFSPRTIERRRTPARRLRAKVFVRDRFCCRYCGGKTLFEPLLRLVGGIYPDAFPWHPNWRGGLTHPAIIARSAVVDHVSPGSRGGEWLGLENLVTACNPCNSIKADFDLEQLGWELQPTPDSDWDGLTRFYPDVWLAAGRPSADYHVAWMADLGIRVPRG